MIKQHLHKLHILIFIIVVFKIALGCSSLNAHGLEFGPPYLLSDAFHNPFGIGIDQSRGHLIVVDTGNHRLAWMALSDLPGTPAWTYFGHVPDSPLPDSALPEALVDPQGVAVDSAGNVYVVDTRQNEVQLFQWDSEAGNYVYVPGFVSATAHEVGGVAIESPRDIAVGPDDRVYLLDSGNKRILVAQGPTDSDWEVFLNSEEWGNPYGITVGHDGKVYIADTDNHRILRFWNGVTDAFGSYGTGPAQFRYPRDVAVDVNDRIFVVDCFNHRIEIIHISNNTGTHVLSLGRAPNFSSIQKIAIDNQGRLFITDSDRNLVIAYLGEDTPVPFDLYIRDYVGDNGTQPSDPEYLLSSPDILIRHAIDVDINVAKSAGLNTYTFQQPRHNEDNFVYIAVHNRGTQPASDAFVRIYWADRSSGLFFPDDFSGTGFYLDQAGEGESNSKMIPVVPAENGVQLIGPFLWHPPAPEASNSSTGDFYIIARIIHPFDLPARGSGISAVYENNNVALRNVKIIRGPFPTGEQNTLVVRVLYPDISGAIDEAELQAKIEEMGVWMEEVSYGEVTVLPLYRGPITLSANSSEYKSPDQNLLVEMATEVINKLIISDPGVLNGPTPESNDDIDRIIMVVNDPDYNEDWATTGHWPYELELGWSDQMGSSLMDQLHDMALNDSGLYLVGATEDSLPGQSNAGGKDAFICKYTLMGTLAWIRQFGTPETDEAYSIALSHSGIYVTGATWGVFPDQEKSGESDSDIFIRKYDINGNELWTRQLGTEHQDQAYCVSVRGTEVYLTGSTSGTFPDQTNSGESDVFITKYDSNGNEIWTVQFGTSEADNAEAVHAISTGVYIAGWTAGSFPSQTNVGGLDAFMGEFDSDGHESRIEQLGSTLNDSFTDLYASDTHVWCVGYTEGDLPDNTSSGGKDAFLCRFDLANDDILLYQFGTSEDDWLDSIDVTPLKIYVAGTTEGTFPSQISSGGKDAFYSEYDHSCNHISTIQFGAADDEEIARISAYSSGLYLSGMTDGILPGQTSAGSKDIFIRMDNISGTGETRHLSVSVQGLNNTMPQFAHGFCHQLGLQDLYIHENVEFYRDYVADGWDNMAKPFEGAHPLVWSKELGTWVTSSGGMIFYIPRPPKEMPPRIGEPPIHINYQSVLESDQYGAIAIGLTEGVTTFEEEHHFYWVEARSPNLGNYDRVVPSEGEGVLVYYANELIPQGRGPVLVQDHFPTTPELTDAVIASEGESESPIDTGITITLESKLPDDDGFLIQVDYDPPETDYDVYIRVGDPSWTSPDIWIDNQRDGEGYSSYDGETLTCPEGPLDEDPIGGQENRVYARIYNTGPGDAYNFDVEFHLSQPHTVGGKANFDLYKIENIALLKAGKHRDVFVLWEPEAEGDPHNCARVHIVRTINDTDTSNNQAQQNLNIINASQASPYEQAVFRFHITNPDPEPKLIYYQTEGIPSHWRKTLTSKKRLLAPNEKVFDELWVQPPEDEPPCTDFEYRVVAWTPSGDTLIQLGGTEIDLHLRKKTELYFPKQAWLSNVENCNMDYINAATPPKECASINIWGCSDPPQPHEKIFISYQDPAGNPVYHEILTDESGCFIDNYVVVEGGEWELTAYYPGNECFGPSEANLVIGVPLENTGDQDGDCLLDKDETQGDTDGDGFLDHLDKDSDNDGIIDGDEDPDNDGFSTCEEYSANTDPFDGSSTPDCKAIFVDADAPNGGSGTSWEDAFNNLPDAINAAIPEIEIWAKEGIYREPSFWLKDGVKLYGGFDSKLTGRMGSIKGRDLENNISIMDGQNQGNNINLGNNSYIDGFTFQDFIISGGGILYTNFITANVANCVFRNNTVNGSAAIVFVNYGTISLLDCVVTNNSIIGFGSGSLVYATHSTVNLGDCVFTGNSVLEYGGGTVYNTNGTASYTNCIFENNSTIGYGGTLYNISSSSIIISCIFRNNSAMDGGAVYNTFGDLTIINSTFVGNSSTNRGGAIWNNSDFLTITNSILWDNSAQLGGDSIHHAGFNLPKVTYSDIEGGWPGAGNINTYPLFVDMVNGDLRLQSNSPCIDAANGDVAPQKDIIGNLRIDDLATTNTGIGIPDYVDIGAYEYPASAYTKIYFDLEIPAGWSMISLPVLPDYASVSSLFPDAVAVYSYKKGVGYERVSEGINLKAGRGYWILLDEEQSYTITGQPIQSYNFPLSEDQWNMIGGCISPAKASADYCTIKVIYKYVKGSGYQRVLESESLEPGIGYWILIKDVKEQAKLKVIAQDF